MDISLSLNINHGGRVGEIVPPASDFIRPVVNSSDPNRAGFDHVGGDYPGSDIDPATITLGGQTLTVSQVEAGSASDARISFTGGAMFNTVEVIRATFRGQAFLFSKDEVADAYTLPVGDGSSGTGAALFALFSANAGANISAAYAEHEGATFTAFVTDVPGVRRGVNRVNNVGSAAIPQWVTINGQSLWMRNFISRAGAGLARIRFSTDATASDGVQFPNTTILRTNYAGVETEFLWNQAETSYDGVSTAENVALYDAMGANLNSPVATTVTRVAQKPINLRTPLLMPGPAALVGQVNQSVSLTDAALPALTSGEMEARFSLFLRTPSTQIRGLIGRCTHFNVGTQNVWNFRIHNNGSLRFLESYNGTANYALVYDNPPIGEWFDVRVTAVQSGASFDFTLYINGQSLATANRQFAWDRLLGEYRMFGTTTNYAPDTLIRNLIVWEDGTAPGSPGADGRVTLVVAPDPADAGSTTIRNLGEAADLTSTATNTVQNIEPQTVVLGDKVFSTLGNWQAGDAALASYGYAVGSTTGSTTDVADIIEHTVDAADVTAGSVQSTVTATDAAGESTQAQSNVVPVSELVPIADLVSAGTATRRGHNAGGSWGPSSMTPASFGALPYYWQTLGAAGDAGQPTRMKVVATPGSSDGVQIAGVSETFVTIEGVRVYLEWMPHNGRYDSVRNYENDRLWNALGDVIGVSTPVYYTPTTWDAALEVHRMLVGDAAGVRGFTTNNAASDLDARRFRLTSSLDSRARAVEMSAHDPAGSTLGRARFVGMDGAADVQLDGKNALTLTIADVADVPFQWDAGEGCYIITSQAENDRLWNGLAAYVGEVVALQLDATVQPPVALTQPSISSVANPTAGDVITATEGTYTNNPTQIIGTFKVDGTTVQSSDVLRTFTLDVSHEGGQLVTYEETPSNAAGTGSINPASNTITTGDVQEPDVPVLLSSDPADGATNVPLSPTFIWEFSENMQAGSGAIRIRRSDDNSVVYTWTLPDDVGSNVTISGTTVTLEVMETAAENTEFYIQCESGALQSTAGIDYPGFDLPDALTFTTGTATTPFLSSPVLEVGTPTTFMARVNSTRGKDGDTVDDLAFCLLLPPTDPVPDGPTVEANGFQISTKSGNEGDEPDLTLYWSLLDYTPGDERVAYFFQRGYEGAASNVVASAPVTLPAVPAMSMKVKTSNGTLTGPAPFHVAVWTEGGSPGVYRDPHFNLHKTDWDDPTSEYQYLDHYRLHGRSAAVSYGPVTSHVYNQPGTYTITHTVKDGVGVDETFTETITVQDRAVVFAGAKTICVSNQADFTGIPAGAQTASTIADALDLWTAGGQILLKRGEIYVDDQFRLNDDFPNLYIGNWGDEADPLPLIDAQTSSSSQIQSYGPGALHVWGVSFYGGAAPWSHEESENAVWATGISCKTDDGLRVSGCEFRNNEIAVDSGKALQDANFIADNKFDGWGSFGCLIAARDGFVTGNYGKQLSHAMVFNDGKSADNAPDHAFGRQSSTKFRHATYRWCVNSNDLSTNSDWSAGRPQASFRVNSGGVPNNIFCATENTFEGGSSVMDVRNSAGGTDNALYPGLYLIEKNVFDMNEYSYRGIVGGYGHCDFRNSLFRHPAVDQHPDTSGWTGGVVRISGERQTIYNENREIRIYCNTSNILHDETQARAEGNPALFSGYQQGDGETPGFDANNIDHLPNYDPPVGVSALLDQTQFFPPFANAAGATNITPTPFDNYPMAAPLPGSPVIGSATPGGEMMALDDILSRPRSATTPTPGAFEGPYTRPAIDIGPYCPRPRIEKDGETTAQAEITTTVAGGTVYAVVSYDSRVPTEAQVEAGQDVTGAAAVASTSFAVPTADLYTWAVTGLAPDTKIFLHFFHRDAGGHVLKVYTALDFPPVIETLFPEKSATDVAVDIVLTVTFNEPVAFNTAGTIALRTNDGGWADWEVFDVATDIGSGPGQVEIIGPTLYIRPSTNLPTNTEMSARFDYTAIVDRAGNASYGIRDNNTWKWDTGATGDTDPPLLLSSVPPNDAVDVSTVDPIVLTFNENVTAGTGLITLRINDGGWSDVETFDVTTDIGPGPGQVFFAAATLTINPTAELAGDREHAVRIAATAVEDLAGNAYAGIADDTTLSFTTASGFNPGDYGTVVSWWKAGDLQAGGGSPSAGQEVDVWPSAGGNAPYDLLAGTGRPVYRESAGGDPYVETRSAVINGSDRWFTSPGAGVQQNFQIWFGLRLPVVHDPGAGLLDGSNLELRIASSERLQHRSWMANNRISDEGFFLLGSWHSYAMNFRGGTQTEDLYRDGVLFQALDGGIGNTEATLSAFFARDATGNRAADAETSHIVIFSPPLTGQALVNFAAALAAELPT